MSNNINRAYANILLGTAAFSLVCITPSLDAADSYDSPYHRFYVRGDAGVAFMQDATIKNTGGAKLSFDPGPRFDVSVGYPVSQYWHAEFQTGFIYNTIDQIAGIQLSSAGASGHLMQVPVMANFIGTLPIRGPVTAYAGAGAGGVAQLYHGESSTGTDDKTAWSFGYQALAGVNYAITARMDVGLAYKFLGTSEHDLGFLAPGLESRGNYTHSVLATFTFKF